MPALNLQMPFPANVETVPVLDADGSHLWDAWVSDAQDLVDKGHARKYGTRKVAIGVTLLVPLSESSIEEIEPTNHEQTALTGGSYGRHYTYEEHILERFYLHQFTGYNRKPTHEHGGAETLEEGSVCLMDQRDFLMVMASVGGTFRLAPTFKGEK